MTDPDDAGLAHQVQELQSRLAEAERLLAARDETLVRWAVFGEQVPAILWTTDAHLRITSSAGAGLAALGQKGGELVGMSLLEYLQTDDPNHPGIVPHLRALRGETAKWELEWLGRTFHSHMEPLRGPDGGITGTIGVALDITERKRAEDLVRQLADLAHFSRLSLMGEMATGLAHELNQPLTAITNYARGCIRRIRTGAIDSPALLEALNEVAGQAARAGEIIHWIRNFVRRREPECVPLALPDLLRNALRIVEPDLRSHRVAARLDLSDGLPQVRVDRIQIEQVVLNLMRNAVEAMASVGSPRELTLSARHDGRARVEVAVADTGCGLKDDLVERVFDPFFTTKPQGLGMGLAISRSIVEAHGGRLWYAANQPRGVVFLFTLPACTEVLRHDPSPNGLRGR
jgi:PAS domain S-box-containing protein